MIDLFAAQVEEFREERAGILEHDGGMTKEHAEAMAFRESEQFRHACEVRFVARMYREQGKDAVVEFLAQVEKHRGIEAMEKLRTDAIAEVKRIRTEQNQNADQNRTGAF